MIEPEKWIECGKGREYPFYIFIERTRGKHAKDAYTGRIYSEEIKAKGNSLDFTLPHFQHISDYADELACVLMTFTHVTADDWRNLRQFFENESHSVQ